jgi:hypothetical protein
MRSLVALICGVFLSAPAQAETLMADYYSLLGPADAYNSRGAPLNDLCAIAQQDRANWHRFGLREEFDGPDPLFNTPARRAAMTGKCAYDRGYFSNPGERIRNGSRSFYVYVEVYGTGGQITRVVISEGAG